MGWGRRARDSRRWLPVVKCHFWDARGRHRSKTFRLKDHAKRFERQVKQRKDAGELDGFDAERTLVPEYWAQWWREYVETRCAQKTQANYRGQWRKHLEPRLRHMTLRDIASGRL